MTQLRDVAPVGVADPPAPVRGTVRRPTWLWWGVALCLAVAALARVLAGFHAPLTYDEAYNLQVVRHLVEHGSYATDGALYDGQPRLFDAWISTGPTLVLPSALLAASVGDHLWVARLAPS